MKRSIPSVLAALSAAVVLAACGGGDGGPIFEDDDPVASGLSGSVTVAGSATAARNGIYASNDVHLNEVEKVDPIGEDPELCRFRFGRLNQTGGPLVMNGDIRYQPGTPTVKVMFISINDVEYSLTQEVGTVDRTNDEIDFAGAPLTSSTGDTIILTGSIPMRDARPEGC